MAEGAVRRILVTGGSGQVGGALKSRLAALGEVYAPGRAELDLADTASIRRVMRQFKPRWVVNPAAYTAVDKAESDAAAAFAINAEAPAILCEEAMRLDAAVIHFSTDYVFDGRKATPYVETDSTGPMSVYGSTKLAGEAAVAASGVPYFIFRTSWVYGATGKNFLLTILKLAREREHLRIVGDQHGAPTWSYDLAGMTVHAIGRIEEAVTERQYALDEAVGILRGVYHAAGAGETTWSGFASRAIAELQAMEPEAKLATVEAITTAEYPTPARRPANSRLDCTKLAEALGWRMPEWEMSLTRVLAEIRR